MPTIVPKSITPTYQGMNVGNSFGLPQSLAGCGRQRRNVSGVGQ